MRNKVEHSLPVSAREEEKSTYDGQTGAPRLTDGSKKLGTTYENKCEIYFGYRMLEEAGEESKEGTPGNT